MDDAHARTPTPPASRRGSLAMRTRCWLREVFAAEGIALLLPLSRLLPPAYRWSVRKKVSRWYAEVQTCDRSARGDPSHGNLAACLGALARIEDETRGVEVPLGFAHELYALRLHVELLAGQIRRRLDGDGSGDGTGGAGGTVAIPAVSA